MSSKDKPWNGLNFTVTGKLQDLTHQDTEQVIRDLGGNPGPSVTGKTHFLIVGERPGSKLDRARKLGVRVIPEEEFTALLEIPGKLPETPGMTPQDGTGATDARLIRDLTELTQAGELRWTPRYNLRSGYPGIHPLPAAWYTEHGGREIQVQGPDGRVRAGSRQIDGTHPELLRQIWSIFQRKGKEP